MSYNSDKHQRRSLRLPQYNYAQAGAYFVTVCTYQRDCILGKIEDGIVRLSEFGKIVETCWDALPHRYASVKCDAFVIMPNHIHGIIYLTEAIVGNDGEVRAGKPRPYTGSIIPLGKVVASFKYQSTKRINALRDMAGAPVWQRNYYEHIVRNDKDLRATRQYIANNPLRWLDDSENPRNVL